jgi:flagellar motor switch protein FliN/FliY
MNMANFEIVENVKIVIRVELGKRAISFPELMKLEPGSVLELNRPTGENVDIYAEKVLFGNGEILVVESNLAVRVADLFYRSGVKKEEGF